jgi:hypothetical protein
MSSSLRRGRRGSLRFFFLTCLLQKNIETMDGDSAIAPLQTAMYSLGLRTPTSRFVGAVAATDLLVYLIKPKLFFDDGGKPLKDATIPWWTVGVGVGAVAALFL